MLIYTSFQTVAITFAAHKPDFDQLDELILKYPDNQEVQGTVHFASFIAFTSWDIHYCSLATHFAQNKVSFWEATS